ncbi:apoptosis-associated speck-like protein containing a CARD isoform X1 [Sphaeramia orbicularis]|uniref:apoptosis-associated speck-like protein containing a CARD isoform X1 n=1 Tax=Sphaeramia orbicularis TaxID=375764 RepID=UPI00117EBDC1|nr:apoptosis-associated speck-like protein containing a CARD isoform X1 [Sphaeramia orbicularis]
MAPDTIRMAILDCLENLEKEDKDKFLYQLIHRGGDPKVRRNKVEGKSLLQITDTLVNTFTEPVAYEVTVELLNKIGCSDDAKELAQVVKSLTSSTPSSSGEASGRAASRPANATSLHFIDKHRVALINRVTNLDAILDELLGQFIDSAGYSKVRAKPTNEEKMREILDVAMKGGTKCKDILYEILERHEKYLLEELNNA